MKRDGIARWILFVSACACLLLPACRGSERMAAAALETARFEEQQFNTEHALQLYRQIVSEYPESAAADQACAALVRLTGVACDTP